MAAAFVGLWFAYLVPHRLRFRQQLLEARTDDRFSDELRVVRVAGARAERAEGTGTRRRPGRSVPSAQDVGRGTRRPYLHPPGRGDGTMHRPHGAADRITADAARAVAAERARRVAQLARRRAAARRRAVLTAVLLVATVAGWSVVGLTTAPVLAGALPSALLVLTLALGRRAVVAARRADAAWAARARELAAPPRGRTSGVVGRAVHPSEARTEVIARVGGARSGAGQVPAASRDARDGRAASSGARRAESIAHGDRADRAEPAVPAEAAQRAERREPVAQAPAPGAGARGTERRPTQEAREDTWAPVPVPRPTYALKPEARRPEPAPLVLDERPAAAAQAPATAQPAEPSASTGGLPTGGRALDALLERRRAAGE